MLKRFISFLIYGIIALGVLGLVSRMFNDPIGFLRNILIIAIVAGIIYMIYTAVTKSKPVKKEQQAFRKAARQSKKRHKTKTTKKDNVASFSAAESSRRIKPRRKSDTHLTVIEGKKNKKKNRASF